MFMAELRGTIRCVLIPFSGGKILLPNATVSEVITYTTPEDIEDTPDWVMGRLRWRGRRILLFSYAMMLGITSSENINGAKIAVLKGIGGNPRVPFVGMLAQGFPRLTLVGTDSLEEVALSEDQPGVHSQVQIKDDHAYVPDIGAIESMFGDMSALQG